MDLCEYIQVYIFYYRKEYIYLVSPINVFANIQRNILGPLNIQVHKLHCTLGDTVEMPGTVGSAATMGQVGKRHDGGPHFVLDTCSQVRAGLRAEEEESFVPPKKGFLKADSETSEISVCRRKSQCYFCVGAKRRAPTRGCPGRRLEYQTFSP